MPEKDTKKVVDTTKEKLPSKKESVKSEVKKETIKTEKVVVPVKVVQEKKIDSVPKKAIEIKEEKERKKELKDLEPKLKEIYSESNSKLHLSQVESPTVRGINMLLKTIIVVWIILSFVLNFILIRDLKFMVWQNHAAGNAIETLKTSFVTTSSERDSLKLQLDMTRSDYTRLQEQANKDRSKVEQINQIINWGDGSIMTMPMSEVNITPVPTGMQP